MSNIDGQITSISSYIKSREGDIARLSSQISVIGDKISALKQSLNRISKQKGSEKTKEQLSEKLNSLRQEKGTLLKSIQEKKDNIEKQKAKLEELKKQKFKPKQKTEENTKKPSQSTQLKNTKKKVFQKEQQPKSKDPAWEERAYEVVKKTASREGSLQKAFDILPPKYRRAYYNIQKQKLGEEKAEEVRQANIKEEKKQIDKDIQERENKEEWLKKADTTVAVARGVTSFITFGASESAIEARYCIEKGDWKGAALHSGEVIILSATAAITNAPGMFIKLIGGGGRIIFGGGKLLANTGKGIYTTIAAQGLKGTLIKGGQYLIGSLPKIINCVKNIPGALPKLANGLKTIPGNALKALTGGSKDLLNGVGTSLKYLPTKGGVVQGLGTLGAMDLAGKSGYKTIESYSNAAKAQTKEERWEHTKQALIETGFAALGAWGLKEISKIAAFQARIVNGKDNLIQGKSIWKNSKLQRAETNLPEESLTQKAEELNLPQDIIDDIAKTEQELIYVDKQLGILREQRACGEGALKIADAPDGSAFPWIPKEALFTSKAAQAKETAMLPGKLKLIERHITRYENYSRNLNNYLRQIALRNGLIPELTAQDLMANPILATDLLTNQQTIKQINDGLNKIKDNFSREELKKKAQEMYEQHLRQILNEKEEIANNLIVGYVNMETRFLTARSIALNTPISHLRQIRLRGETGQLLKNTDDFLKAGVIKPPTMLSSTDKDVTTKIYDDIRKRTIIASGKNIKKCAEELIGQMKRAAAYTREEFGSMAVQEGNIAGQVIDNETGLIIGEDGSIESKLINLAQPQGLIKKIENTIYKIFLPPGYPESVTPEHLKFRFHILPASILGAGRGITILERVLSFFGITGPAGSALAAFASQARGFFYGIGSMIGKDSLSKANEKPKKPGENFAKGTGIRLIGDGMELSMFGAQMLPPPLNIIAPIALYEGAELFRGAGDVRAFSDLVANIEWLQAKGKSTEGIRAAATAQSAVTALLGLGFGYLLKGILSLLPPFAFPIAIAGLATAEYALIKKASMLADEVISQNKLENLTGSFIKTGNTPKVGAQPEKTDLDKMPEEIKKVLDDQAKKPLPINPRAQITQMYSEADELSGLIEIYRGENYLLTVKNNEINIVYHRNADSGDKIKAMLQAEILREKISSQSYKDLVAAHGESQALRIILKDTLREAGEKFPEFLEKLKKAGWKIEENLALPPGNAVWQPAANLNADIPAMQSRQQQWLEKRKETDGIEDVRGRGVDENIKETVTSLNVNGINTNASCEGHVEQGYGPNVDIEAPNMPWKKYINQETVARKIAKKYSLELEELENKGLFYRRYIERHNIKSEDEKSLSETSSEEIEFYEKARTEALVELRENGYTKQYVSWIEENKKLRKTVEETLADFYRGRNVSDDKKIKFLDLYDGTFKIYSGPKADYSRDPLKLTDEQKEALARRIEEYQEEMNAFGEYLKERFIREGPIIK